MTEHKINVSKKIFVNATAAQYGGALTIIQQFIDAFVQRRLQDTELYVFCSVALNNDGYDAVKLIRSPRKGFYQRLSWDYKGMKQWSRRQGIRPDLILSFQNTGVFFKGIPQVIYLHNAIPFSPHNWSLAKKEERTLWFYKRIYPFFIRISLNKNTRFVVQTEWMKKKVAEKFGWPPGCIEVARPFFSKERTTAAIPDLDVGTFYFFYPASPLLFKNHEEIINALSLLLTRKGAQKIKICFTCREDALPVASRAALEKPGLREYFVFLDSLKFEEVLGYYMKADALLFPSKIETVGLPLLEAASYGMPVIAADEAYSREILEGYNNVAFVPAGNAEAWSKAMQGIMQSGERKKDARPIPEDGWIKVFSLIESILKQ